MKHSVFKIELTVVPQCDEPVNKGDIRAWLNEHLVGIDLGDVVIGQILEAKLPRTVKGKYLLVGGTPFTGYSGTTSFTSLKVVGISDSKDDMKQMYSDNYEECGGLLIIIDTETFQPIEGW